MDELRRESFPVGNLVRVPSPAAPVVLKSGGPVMNLLGVTDGIALCEWLTADDRLSRGTFPVPCLYRCVPAE